jgi:hypothetical protein
MAKGEAQQIILVCWGCGKKAKLNVEKIDWKYGKPNMDRVRALKDRNRFLEEKELWRKRVLAEQVEVLNKGIINLNKDLLAMREQEFAAEAERKGRRADDFQGQNQTSREAKNRKLAVALGKGITLGLAKSDAVPFKNYLERMGIKSRQRKDGSWYNFSSSTKPAH